ncbi:phosphate ABC transporter ATP-binding protein [uncultured Desulfovibrio sp.]|uniref:phosphate ABC transporter ATP-binding protein n=1 Tax=uncultured Desulfovibrio sp. TaxID=167968 RepID=UPI00262A3D0A|nr:phosphate ABC transporter ATP-binding protein [uncultured Desulfovibrio sp.]
MPPLADIEGLSVSFGGQTVIHELSAALPAEGLTVVIGRSGSGKTTFLRAFNRLNEEFPGCETRGQIRLHLDDTPLPVYPRPDAPDAPTLAALRRRVGMVFQSPNVFPCSILENLLLPLRALGICPARQAEERARQALRDVGLWEDVHDRLRRPAATLSGGQQQRLCFARALVLDPALLLLDEPTASLDPLSAGHIESLIRSLAATRRLLMVSHNLPQALRLASHLWLFAHGRLSRTLSAPFPPEHELAALL